MNNFREPWHIGHQLDTIQAWPEICNDANVSVFTPRTEDEADRLLPTMERVIACVNACRGIPTELLGRVEHACIADNARMLGLELRPTHLDLLAIAEILRKAGFDVREPVRAGR
jgi:hypothetical protein